MTEDRFTPSREFCPHPEYWHSPDSEATETEVSEFIGAVVRLIQPEYVVETGTYHGHTAIEIGKNLIWNNHGRLVSVENDGIYHNIAKDRLLEESKSYPGLIEKINLVLANTMDFVPEQEIDFAFFDSWQEGRHLEFMRFHDMGKLKIGSIVAFHDTAPHHQVLKHIANLEITGYITPIYFRTPRGLVLAQVAK